MTSREQVLYYKHAVKKDKRSKRRKKIFDIALMILIGFFVLFPFYVLIATSVMSVEESNYANFKFWPEHFSLESYYKIIFGNKGGYSLPRGFLNTILYYLPSSIIGVIVSAISAFAFAKMHFKFKNAMFAILMATMMIPNTMSLIISFLVYDVIGWIGTALPIIIPRMFGTVGCVFFLRQYYMSLPKELIDSSKVDGLGWFGTFWRIMFPLSLPAVVTQIILFFIAGYNDYLAPLLYLPYSEQATLQLVLAQYEDPYIQDWPVRMAGCIVSMIPMIALYLSSQKTILKDMSVGSGFKG